MKITMDKNQRGFVNGKFKDLYDVECSIQESSLATESAIWLGVNKPDPKILAYDAIKMGRRDLTQGKELDGSEQTTGWVTFPVPQEVSMATRMHLTQDMVKDLLPTLQYFVKTGQLPQSEDDLKKKRK